MNYHESVNIMMIGKLIMLKTIFKWVNHQEKGTMLCSSHRLTSFQHIASCTLDSRNPWIQLIHVKPVTRDNYRFPQIYVNQLHWAVLSAFLTATSFCRVIWQQTRKELLLACLPKVDKERGKNGETKLQFYLVLS